MNTTSNQTTAPFISKSKFIWGLQCSKLLWHAYNAKELLSAPDAATQAIFDQGHKVGTLAKTFFPNGIEVGQGIEDFDELLRLSREAIKSRRPLFEAAFTYQSGYARVDILNPVAGNGWNVIEVKSSTSIKDVYIFDLAFQAFVYSGAGLKIRRCILMLINSDFVRQGEVDPAKFFTRHDVTPQVSAVSSQIESHLEEMFRVIRSKSQPEISIGTQCHNPYPCSLIDHCWKFLPDENVTTLYRSGAKGFQLLADGITKLSEIPDDFRLTENQEIQRQAALSGQPHVDKPAIREFIRQIEYPMSFLDFETLATAIPLFDGVKPYQQIPFQFSLHVVRAAGAKPEHHSFLAEGNYDPRLEFMHQIGNMLPKSGSIITYNASFEIKRLEECCTIFHSYKPWLNGVKSRIVDLLQPFRGFRYYHPKQNGSASMKMVLPALTGHGYEHLAIQDGNAASLEFLRMYFNDVSDVERQRARRALEEYCGLDTGGMFEIINALINLVSN